MVQTSFIILTITIFYHLKHLILKGHSQLWDRADLDTTFASLKSDYLNPK